MDARPDDDAHAKFRDLCLLYGDFNRGIFLEEILEFINGAGASKSELSAIRSAVQQRSKQLAQRVQRARPRAGEDREWMRRAVAAAYSRHVLGWTWKRIAEAFAMKPNKPNLRTLQRREQQYAEIVALALAPLNVWEWGEHGKVLKKNALDYKPYQRILMRSAGLPFHQRPEECKKLIEALLR